MTTDPRLTAGEPPILSHEERCRDCQACALACSLDHEGGCGPSLARLMILKDMASYRFRIVLCRHCPDPACLAACPSGALVMDPRGVALLDDDACIRCGACADACPYEAIAYHAASDRYLKCDLCADRDDGPLCVRVCPVGALALAQPEQEA